MAEAELQHLMERIQSDAIDKAEKQADEIVSKAKQKAASIVSDAEKQAKDKLEQADRDAQAYAERSKKTLEQAARDLLITVGKGVENILSDLVTEAVDDGLGPEVIEKMLMKIAEACAEQDDMSQIEFLVSPKEKDELVKFFAQKYREKMVKGIELHTDREIVKGFKVSLVDDYVYHDFTREAIAEALQNFLRADLSEIVHRVAKESSDSDKADDK
jgi:V/A-type H+-transporting ATPase subunit E